jgi:hypothetical protein
MTLMLFSGAWGKIIHETNLKQKISCHCPFKVVTIPLVFKITNVGKQFLFILIDKCTIFNKKIVKIDLNLRQIAYGEEFVMKLRIFWRKLKNFISAKLCRNYMAWEVAIMMPLQHQKSRTQAQTSYNCVIFLLETFYPFRINTKSIPVKFLW